MSLFSKPHTFTLATASKAIQSDKTVWPPSFAAPVTLTGQITVKKPEAAFLATGLQLTQPHLLLCEKGNEALFVVGSKIVYNSRIFKVMTPPMIQDATGTANHLSIWLQEMQFASS